MTSLLKAGAFTAIGALLAMPAFAQGNQGPGFDGPQPGYHSGQYGGSGQMAYGPNDSWNGNSAPNQGYDHQGIGNENFGSRGFGNQDQQRFGSSGENGYGGHNWPENTPGQSSSQGQWHSGNWQSGRNGENWQNGFNEQSSGMSRSSRSAFRQGFEAGFNAGYSAGYTNAFNAGHNSLAGQGSSSPGTQSGLSSSETNGSAPAGQSAAGSSSVSSSSQMSESQIRSQLQQGGYSNIRNLHQSGDTFQATADKNGQSMQVTVDGKTGDVISSSKSSG